MNKPIANIAVLILAAGASERMGSIKQLLPYRDSTLLGHAIEQAKQVFKKVYVVLGANADTIAGVVPKDVAIIKNPQWQKGMGTSISIGVKTIRRMAESDAVLIMLADQPLIDSKYLAQLKELFCETPDQIAATQYENKNGVPAIFDAALFREIEQLDADFGAQKLIKEHAHALKSINAGTKIVDIDTPENYKELKTNTSYK